MTHDPPRVAICVPSGDMVHADFALCLAGLTNETREVEIHIISNKSSIVAAARNQGVEMALERAVDHLLFLDSNMVFPRETLRRLLAHDLDIVGATYTKRVPPYPTLGALLPDAPRERIDQGLVEMLHLPTGCLLIRASVFQDLSKPWFRFETDEEAGVIRGEDYVFCERARAAGHRVWCDLVLSHDIGHLGQRVCRMPEPD